MIRFWSKDGDGVTKVNALKFAGSSSWGRIDFSATMPALPLAAVKKVGVVPDWKEVGVAPDVLAASGLFTVSDPADDAIIDQCAGLPIRWRTSQHTATVRLEGGHMTTPTYTPRA